MTLRRRTPLAASRRPGPARKPPRDTGPSDAMRQRVYIRDAWSCVACGRNLETVTWRSIQHRVARGVGGGNTFPNLILLCGSATSAGCHRKAEDRDPDMHAKGYWLRSHEDPATTPILLVTEFTERWVLPTADGTYADYDPEEAPVAP